MEEYDSVIITHGGCADGTTSAHLFSMFPLGNVKVYHSYEREFEKNKNMPSLVGKKVFIVDYSFPIPVLLNIAKVASHLYIYDHHESTKYMLFGLADGIIHNALSIDFAIAFSGDTPYVPSNALMCGPYRNNMTRDIKIITNEGEQIYCNGDPVTITHYCRINLVIDLSLCGAEITWQELSKMSIRHGGREIPRPWYLTHVRDRDLWLWDRPENIPGVHYDINSKAFGEAFYEARINCETLKILDMYSEEDRKKFYSRGRELIEHNSRIVKSFVSKAQKVKLRGHVALAVCSDILQSEIGNALVKTAMPESKYVPTIGVVYRYNIAGKYWMISLRGIQGSPNLAEIAKEYGGGGHPLAAGFDYHGDITQVLIDNSVE